VRMVANDGVKILIVRWVDGQSGEHPGGSGQKPNSGTGGSSSATTGATLGPVFVVSLT